MVSTKPIIYMTQGGAPDKISRDNNYLEYQMIDRSKTNLNISGWVDKVSESEFDYLLICSEDELNKLHKYKIPNSTIILKSNSINTEVLWTKLNLVELGHAKVYKGETKFDSPKIIKHIKASGGRGNIIYYPGLDILKNDILTNEEGNYIVQDLLDLNEYTNYAVSVIMSKSGELDYGILKCITKDTSSRWYNFSYDHRKKTTDIILPIILKIIKDLDIFMGIFEVEIAIKNNDVSNYTIIDLNPRYSQGTSCMHRVGESFDIPYDPVAKYLDICPISFKEVFQGKEEVYKITENIVNVKDILWSE